MRLLIDNLDGLGSVEYTDQLAPEGPIEIVRTLNAPSSFGCELLGGPLETPKRLSRVVVSRMIDGTVLFTGYLTTEPEMVYAGEVSTGSVYRLRLTAESDDWLLDKQGIAAGGDSFGLSGAALLMSLTTRVDATRFATQTNETLLTTGISKLDFGKPWSENAAAVASATYASYRVVGGVVELQPLGTTSYTLQPTDGSLQQQTLKIGHGAQLINDVTISGPMEAGAYVTELFQGDGTTATFQLSGAPFRGHSGSSAILVSDTFSDAVLNTQIWSASDPGSHISLGAAGLLLNGGNGTDGATTLQSVGDVELAGGLIMEASGVVLNQGSDGVLLGLYSGPVSRATCVAGFDVRQANGSTTIGPLIGGVTAGTLLTVVAGHSYVLRLRIWCGAMERVRQSFYVGVDQAIEAFGGGLVSAPVSVVLEVRDMTASSNTPVTVLYDGGLANSAASGTWAPVNSIELQGSISSLTMTATGSAWVRETTSTGVTWTRLMGISGEGVDGDISGDGELRFFSGRVPAAGDLVTVLYRRSQRAVARLVNTASVASEGAGGLPGTSAWTGSVLTPLARSTEDCAAAAAAVLAIGGSRTAALEGSYQAGNMPDVWPGDALVLSGVPNAAVVLARTVKVRDAATSPELIQTEVRFANDWVSSPSLRLSNTLAADVPTGLAPLPAATASVADLSGLTVTAISTSAVQVDAGTAPPTGGGFEVRRRDGGFGPGVGADLVLRSPVRGFSIPRAAMTERFYVRMYDGSTPPAYSWRSSSIVTDVPVS